MTLSAVHIIGVAVVLGGILYRALFHPFFVHPLRHIPAAHWSIPLFGDTWILYQRYKSRNNAVTFAAHQKYGPVVRMGRNELSVNCVDNGIRTIYAGGWEKHSWYASQFASYGVINMFATVHRIPHAQKKRIQANVYSKSFVAAAPQVAANTRVILFQRILPLLHSFALENKTIDAHEWNNACTIDFMSAFLFGLANSTNFVQQPDVRKSMLHKYHCRRDYEFYGSEVPWVKPLTEKLRIPLIPEWYDAANTWLENWCADMSKGAEKYLNEADDNQQSKYVGNEPLAYKQFRDGMMKLRSNNEYNDKAMSGGEQIILPTARHTDLNNDNTMAEIYSEMLDTLGAGHETSAIALTYLFWEMSRNPHLQKELREELTTLQPPIMISDKTKTLPTDPPEKVARDNQLPDPKQIDTLPLLNAIVMETLRLHSPIPGMEPRVSPHIKEGSTLGPYTNIPGGVRVSSMPYTLHRNAEVFPDPETFNPRRWLLEPSPSSSAISPSNPLTSNYAISADHLKEMHRWFWAFGSGGRMCIGSHLATQTIKLLTTAVYSNFTTEIVDDQGIEAVDAYTTRPKANRLMIRLRRV